VKPPQSIPRPDALAGIRRRDPPAATLVEVIGDDADQMTRVGMEAYGGMRHFVSEGDRVVITPNFAWARPPEVGATTRPEMVRRIIELCWDAGAKSIVCLDYASDMTPRAFKVSGAYKAIQGTGARLLSPWSPEQFVRVGDFHRAGFHDEKLGWQAVASVLTRCDVLIDMPVFKHHRDVGVTGALKKLMGCVWRRAGYHHVGIHRCIAELSSVLRPTLTVMDAVQVLSTNGPNGPGKLVKPGRVVIAADPVLADAHACQWLEVEPKEVEYLARAAKLKVGQLSVGDSEIERITVKA
jgi:uncharacterized protein (DUF362 family)